MDGILEQKILDKSVNISVIGLGYVGLPLAIALAKTQYHVLGIEKNKDKIKELEQGKSYIIDVEDDELQEAMRTFFTVSSNYSLLQSVDVIIICVPTPLNDSKEPDISYITSAVNEIIKYIKPNTLIVLESTTYPGTTDNLITDRIEKETGLIVGENLFVCYSPERTDPGNKKYYVVNTPKVIGGTTPNCLKIGELLYKSFLNKIVPVSSTRVAETAKLLENTFRSINIAWINEMAMMCDRMRINIWEVISAASTKPFGFMPFYPGPGIGGHCIPLDPMYLAWEGKKYNYYNRFIELASDINSNIPRYMRGKIQEILNQEGKCIKGTPILLIGITYKKDIDDLRESPAIELYELLKADGADITYHDPYVSSFYLKDQEICSVPLEKEVIKSNALIVILTDHTCIDYKYLLEESKIIFDTRNILNNIVSTEIRQKYQDKIKLVGNN